MSPDRKSSTRSPWLPSGTALLIALALLLPSLAPCGPREAGEPRRLPLAGADLDLVWVPGGHHVLGGATAGEREVELAHGFWVAVNDVTVAQWNALSAERRDEPPDRPVHDVDGRAARALLDRANRLLTGGHLRTPTEDEWEVARGIPGVERARGGNGSSHGLRLVWIRDADRQKGL